VSGVDLVLIVVALAVGVAVPRWWLFVPTVPLMVLGFVVDSPGSGAAALAPFAIGLGIALRNLVSGSRGRYRPPHLTRPRAMVLATLALYAGVISAYIYGVENTERVNSGVWGAWWLGASLLLAIHLAVGVVVGDWWAAFVPALAVLLALPAGENPAYDGDIESVAFTFIILLPFEMAIVIVGVAARKVLARLHRRQIGRRPRAA
jgi:hypothetical protein